MDLIFLREHAQELFFILPCRAICLYAPLIAEFSWSLTKIVFKLEKNKLFVFNWWNLQIMFQGQFLTRYNKLIIIKNFNFP